jgi:hypothetical protein
MRLKRLNHPVPFRGGELSIQANEHAYCIPKSDKGPYSCVEVAYFSEDTGDMVLITELADRADGDGGEGTSVVHGYVDVTRVKELLKDDGYTEQNIKSIFDRIDTVCNYDR